MASKNMTKYVCDNCGADYSKWLGQCSQCKEWQTLKEFKIAKETKPALAKQGYATGVSNKVLLLKDVDHDEVDFFTTHLSEFDRVLGGGLVLAGSILIGGSPGAGKSTLLLQTACLVSQDRLVLYVTGEEVTSRIKSRA